MAVAYHWLPADEVRSASRETGASLARAGSQPVEESPRLLKARFFGEPVVGCRQQGAGFFRLLELLLQRYPAAVSRHEIRDHRDGDEIRLGTVQFLFRSLPRDAATATARE
jgi:hypothetical protein